eukprot:scaffold483_cov63-Phaeocystis_antarctica.AAC.1
MSWYSNRLYDFNAPNRLKLGWMGPQSVVTYNAATGGVEDSAGASVLWTAYVSALNLGPAMDRHLLLKIPCPTCTSAWDRLSHGNGNVYVSFRGDDAAGSTYGVDNTINWLYTFEGGTCTTRNLRLMTNRVHVHYQRSGVPSELWTTLAEGESYEIAGAAMAIHVCTISSELDAVVTVGVDSVAAKALCTTPWPPPAPPSPPSSPRTTFDFSDGIAASSGWSTGGGEPPYAFTKREGSTSSSNTGPSAGVGGSGSYVYAETSSPRVQGDLFTLAYDGSACSGTGAGVSTVAFHYHMYGATMGELRVVNAAGEVVWSLNGNKGNSWQVATVDVYSPSFAFEYTRGSSWSGDAAMALVAVSCGAALPAAPPSLPPAPLPPSPTLPPPSPSPTPPTAPDCR